MPRYTNEQIAEALHATKGMKYLASRRLQCSPQTIINRVAASPALQAIVAQEHGERLDTAELKLHEAVLAGEAWAVKYILSNQGKDRGFTERQEHTGEGGGPIQHSLTLAEALSDHQDEDEA